MNRRADASCFGLDFQANAAILLSIHNIRFLVKLMEDAREAILNDSFGDFYNEVFNKLK